MQGCVEGLPPESEGWGGTEGASGPKAGVGGPSRGFSDPEREPTVCTEGSPRLLGAHLLVASTEALPQHPSRMQSQAPLTSTSGKPSRSWS